MLDPIPMCSQHIRARFNSSPNDGKGTDGSLTLENSRISLEHGPAGTVARVDRPGESPDYAGPLTTETIRALREVSQG